MKLRLRWLVSLMALAVVWTATTAARASDQQPFPGFDEYVKRAMQECDTPGLAVCVVQDDRIVFSRGYGTRKLGAQEPVDENTVFAIGSTSKAFTAALIGTLVDKGKMSWDGKVVDYLPWFHVNDPYVTGELTIRDCLSHRSGIRGASDGIDLLWYASPFSREEVIKRLRYEKPTGFRSRFNYNNVMVITAGECAAAAGGDTWDSLIKKTFFEPLGMSRSCTSVRELDRLSNVASPHAIIDGSLKVVPYRLIDNAGPAGSINSCAKDMSQWVRLQLNHGRAGDKQIISDKALAETHIPHSPVVQADLLAGRLFPAYGLGWGMVSNHGHKMLTHEGGIDGMTALVQLLPDAHTGFVILANRGESKAPESVAIRMADAYLKQPLEDGLAIILPRSKKAADKEVAEYQEARQKRVSGTHPALPLDRYAGRYSDPEFGDIVIIQDNGALVLEYGPNRKADLRHWHFDTFEIEWRDRIISPHMRVVFLLDDDGQPSRMEIPGLTTFTRKAEDKTAKLTRL